MDTDEVNPAEYLQDNGSPHFQELPYDESFQPMPHTIKSTTRMFTQKYPPDNFFAGEGMHYQENPHMRDEHQQQQQPSPQKQQQHQQSPPYRQRRNDEPDPPVYRQSILYKPEQHASPPPKLTTTVVMKKWPPDSWFDQARKEALSKPIIPQHPPPAASPKKNAAERSASQQGHRGASQPGQRGVPEQHTPIPLRGLGLYNYDDNTSTAYNAHGFWPYQGGQPQVRASRTQFHRPPPEEHFSDQGRYALPQPMPAPESVLPREPSARAPSFHGSVHNSMHNLAVARQPSQYVEEVPEFPEEGEHFQCNGCGCHIRPSEVMYRPRVVPCLPPDVEHTPVPIKKPKPPPQRLIRGGPPPRPVAPKPKPAPAPPPYIPQPPPPEVPYVKDVPNFDFDAARREGEEKARKEKEDAEQYKIKTIEDFDFEAARRAGMQQHAPPPPPAPEPEKVKIIEDFDFEAARRAGTQQPPAQAAQNPNFDFEAARAKVAAAAAARYGDTQFM